MKNIHTLNLSDDLALAVQEFIYNAVSSTELLLVFYTPVTNSKLKVLTMVVDKQNYEVIVNVLQPQIDALNSLENYDTLITINYHKVSSNDSHFHFSYLQLHLQPCFVIYGNHLKTWNSLFQNFYSTDKQKAINHFRNYSKEIENRVREAISVFVTPLLKQQVYDGAHLALLEVFSYSFELLKNILLPKSVHHKYNEQEFTSFIDTYYPEFSKIVYKISKMKEDAFIDQSQYIIGETPISVFDKMMKRTLELQTNALKQLNVFYTKRTNAQLSDKSSEEILLKQLVAFLVNGYKIDAIYLLSSNSNDTYKFNLLLISSTLRIQQHDALAQKVSNHFKGKVEVFCLIHSLEWIKKNKETFQLFFKNNTVPQNVLYLKSNLVINNKMLEIQNYSKVKQLQKLYWEERLAYVSPWFTAFQNQDLIYQSGHILLLKNMLKQLILGLLYQKVQYIPALYSCRYLMQLFQALLPNSYKECVQPNDVKEILNLLNTSMSYFPRYDGEQLKHDQLAFTKALCLCEKLFNEIEITNI